MRKKIRAMTAIYKNIYLSTSEARKIRGFFADLDTEDSNLHNHTGDGQNIYRYPLVQYKVLKGNPVIVALEDGIRSIHPHLMKQKELKIGEKIYKDMALDIHLSELPVGDSRDKKTYSFLTPWLALNQDNFIRYQSAAQEEKQKILDRILIGNILSLCKGFGVTIENELSVTHNLKNIPVIYKEKRMQGFIGSFQVNCCIPEMCGLGKGTARGYGTVKFMPNREEDEG